MFTCVSLPFLHASRLRRDLRFHGVTSFDAVGHDELDHEAGKEEAAVPGRLKI